MMRFILFFLCFVSFRITFPLKLSNELFSYTPIGVSGSQMHTGLTSWEQTRKPIFPRLRSDFTQSELRKWFAGDFDNYHQVVRDRRKGLLPREGGGHEHIHCCLRQVPTPGHLTTETARDDTMMEVQWSVLARYYFDADPEKMFRLRLYTFYSQRPKDGTADREKDIRMRIYKILPEEIVKLKQNDFDLGKVDWNDQEDPICELIEGCDIIWSKRKRYYQGIMPTGGAKVDSEMRPGTKIYIKDDLKLHKNTILLNDQGFDMDGNIVYGNHRNIPYKLQRVTKRNRLLWTLDEN